MYRTSAHTDASELVQHMRIELKTIMREHVQSLHQVFPALESSLTDHMQAALALFRDQSVQVSASVAFAQHEWSNLVVQFVDMHQRLAILSGSIVENADLMNTSIEQAKSVLAAQKDVERSASGLSTTLHQLSNTTLETLMHVNGTLNRLTQTTPYRDWILSWITPTASFISADTSRLVLALSRWLYSLFQCLFFASSILFFPLRTILARNPANKSLRERWPIETSDLARYPNYYQQSEQSSNSIALHPMDLYRSRIPDRLLRKRSPRW
ncbi:unnamed protein product [Mycena citricolor]|nr:unnamed protein product [Mycena citricolor]